MRQSRLVAAVALMAAISCTKTGPQGAKGTTGAMGDANVLTRTFTLTNSDWAWNSSYNFQTSAASFTEYFTRYADEPVPAITPGILDSGMVLVFFTPNTSGNTNQWAPLPYGFADASGSFDYELAFETNVGTVRFHFFFVQTNTSASIPSLGTYDIATYQFKVVVVSGVTTTAMRRQHVNLGDYGAVSKFIGLE